MLFNMDKKNSCALMKIISALSILLIPSFLGKFSLESAVYIAFTLFAAVSVIRMVSNSKFDFPLQYSILLLLMVYGLISFLWVENPVKHLEYLFAIGAVIAFCIVFKDYITESNSEGFQRRLTYLVSGSGVLCAGINILYWIMHIVPVAGTGSFKQGLASGDYVGIFMALSILSTFSLYKKNSKGKKALLIPAVIMMIFTFFMSESAIAWIFLIALIFLNALKKKEKKSKNYMLASLGIIVLYSIAVIICLANSINGKAFADVMGFTTRNLFGAGGGFWSADEMFSRFDYGSSLRVGLFPYLSVTAGIIGMISCFLMLVINLVLVLKLKSVKSMISLMLFITLLLIPFEGSISVVLLIAGLCVYNECAANVDLNYSVKNSEIRKIKTGVTVAVVISSVLMILSFVKTGAYSDFKNGEYEKSYEAYKFVASVNFLDNESCAMAALSICKDKDLLKYRKNDALSYIDKAINADSSNLENHEIKAKIYYGSEDYELCAQQYRKISSKSAVKDRYNLPLAKALYKISAKYPKGSSESKRAYEEIVAIWQETDVENFDLRKEIFDLADKALVYTKGELNSEREDLAR